MFKKKKILIALVACTLSTFTLGGGAVPVLADNAGAFIGGVFASRLMGNMRRRTEAQESMAASSASQPAPVVVAPAPAAPAQKSPQARIQELDKLAAGGYITPEEYKRKKQSIIDGL